MSTRGRLQLEEVAFLWLVRGLLGCRTSSQRALTSKHLLPELFWTSDVMTGRVRKRVLRFEYVLSGWIFGSEIVVVTFGEQVLAKMIAG